MTNTERVRNMAEKMAECLYNENREDTDEPIDRIFGNYKVEEPDDYAKLLAIALPLATIAVYEQAEAVTKALHYYETDQYIKQYLLTNGYVTEPQTQEK